MPGGRIDIEVGINAGSVPGKLERDMQPALGVAKKVAGAIGLTLGAAGVMAVGKQILAIGDTYTNTMNTMSAVSGASASQMAAVSERAKQLGNDIQLPGMSASDAAAAMTELAKGGFTVQESMDAAKGTLQLAAAAQIDAASAATIQSQALQSFGLNADYAAKTSDVLANAANASSAEITDIASGLQQSGAVANQFGMTIEDTAASLGVLANAGIAGSDAGTLIKSALLALTDGSKPAQAAIEELGLTVYNAEGQFVGMSSLFGQLDEAAARMTPEMYQASTATLFGSDAMRLAGIAAEQGSVGFDTMLTAINREGAAAEVAAAKTKGLPGALETVTNSAESLALGIYDLVDGPMESFARATSEKITSVTPQIIDGFVSVGSALAPVADGIGTVVGAFLDLPAPVQAAAAALAAVKVFGVDDKITGWVDTLTEKFQGFREEMEVQQSIADSAATEYDGLGEAIGENAEPLSEMAAGLATLEARVPAIGRMGDAYRGVTDRTTAFATRQRDLATATGGVTGALRTGVAQVGRFAGAVGGGAMAAVSGLKSAAGGVVSALGGGWMLGITAATTTITAWYKNVQEAKAHTEAYDNALKNIKKSQSSLGDIFSLNDGKYDDQAIANITTQVDDLSTSLKEAAANDAQWNNVVSDMFGDIVKSNNGSSDDISKNMDQVALANREAQAAIEDTGLTSEQVAQKLSSDDATWREFEKTLRASGDGGDMAADKLNELRGDIQTLNDVARRTTPGFFSMTEAVKVLADESSTAADRLDAMNTVLDIMSGKPIAASDALQKYNQQVRDTAAVTSEAWDKTQGWGRELIAANGEIATGSTNGDKLRTTLKEITEATKVAASSGNDMGPIWEQNAKQFADLGVAAGLSKEEIEQLAASVGYSPKNFELVASLAGADSVEQQLITIKALLDQNADGIDIPVTALTDDVKRELESAGAKVEEVTGKPGVFHISAPNKEALAAIQAVIDRNIPNKTFTIIVDSQGAEARLRAFGSASVQGPLPAVLPVGAAGGRLPGYAGGGRMPSTGPGTSTVDGIYAVTPEGVAIAKVNRNEWIINDKSSDKYNRELAMINAGTFPKLPGFAEGGRLAQDRIEDLGRRMDGVGYVLGGASFAGADCSGYVAMHQRAAMGEDPPVGRLGTTYSLLDGSWPDLVPGSKGPFVVGTSQEHMALTAFGTNYESGGAYGAAKMGGSVGAFDSQFTKQFYLPWELFSPPVTDASGSMPSVGVGGMSDSYSSSKKATWTEKDKLNLKSAVIAVTQAQEAQARINADVTKTPADRAQAQTKVEKAEERVRSYEAKRDAAAAGRDAPPAPEAPELTSARTDDQISQRQAERAIEKARLDRNEIYASADSTQQDKDEADDALQSALNALSERGASGSGSMPSTWSEAFGEIAKEFVSSNVSDILGYYGGSDSIGPLFTAGAAVSAAAKNDFGRQPNVPISASDAATQLPVTPGIDGWWESMTKALGAKIPLYDTGGEWPDGTPGMNRSGHTELVLTHEQRKQAGQDFALLSSLAAANRMPQQDKADRRPSGRDAFASQRPINVTATGYDRNEIAAGIQQARRIDEYESAQYRI